MAGQPDQSVEVAASGREVTVPSLPAGDSTVSLALIWAPGETIEFPHSIAAPRI